MEGRDIYITGYTHSFESAIQDAFLARYNVDGNILWNTLWGGRNSDHSLDVNLEGINTSTPIFRYRGIKVTSKSP